MRRSKPFINSDYTMDKFTIAFMAFDQQRILLWGSPCGYCGTKPNMPVNFFAGTMNTLTDEEKADAISYVQEQVGPVKRTQQTMEAFRVLERRANSVSQ